MRIQNCPSWVSVGWELGRGSSASFSSWPTALSPFSHLTKMPGSCIWRHKNALKGTQPYFLKITAAAALLRKPRKETWNFHSVDHPQESTGQITNCWASPAINSGYHLTQGLLWVSWTQFSLSKLRKVSEKMRKSLWPSTVAWEQHDMALASKFVTTEKNIEGVAGS